MPNKPLRPCKQQGCPQLTRDGYCPDHKREQTHYDQHRGSAAERGYDRRWQKARKYYLAKHPFCVKCQDEGQLTMATVVDHIIPHKGDKALFWDSKNWQPLCKRHHDQKTVRQDGGFGR